MTSSGSRLTSSHRLVTAVPECHDATVAWELDTDEWEDEKAFDKKWYSVMTVAAQLPVLVTREGVPKIEEVRVSLTENLDADFDQLPSSSLETVTVNEDGTIDPAANPVP